MKNGFTRRRKRRRLEQLHMYNDDDVRGRRERG